MKKILTTKAPKPSGHYSQAVIHNNTVYISGQLPIESKTGNKCVGSIEEQTELVLNNISEILIASDSSKDKVLKTTVYVSDIKLWDRVNKIYADFFGEHKPVRVVVPTRDLHYGFKIEIDAIAVI